MTVLVTGGAGYIGSHMVLALAEAGEDVTPNDDESGDALDHLGVEKTGEDHL